MMLAKRRIRPDAADGDVEVPAPQLVGCADALKRRVEANLRVQRLVDAPLKRRVRPIWTSGPSR